MLIAVSLTLLLVYWAYLPTIVLVAAAIMGMASIPFVFYGIVRFIRAQKAAKLTLWIVATCFVAVAIIAAIAAGALIYVAKTTSAAVADNVMPTAEQIEVATAPIRAERDATKKELEGIQRELEVARSRTLGDTKNSPPKVASGGEIGYVTLSSGRSGLVVTSTSAAIKEAIVQPTRQLEPGPLGTNSLLTPSYSIPLSIVFVGEYGPFDVFVASGSIGISLSTVPNIAVTKNEASRLEILITPSNTLTQIIGPFLLSFRKQ
jgi:hypothetical protein